MNTNLEDRIALLEKTIMTLFLENEMKLTKDKYEQIENNYVKVLSMPSVQKRKYNNEIEEIFKDNLEIQKNSLNKKIEKNKYIIECIEQYMFALSLGVNLDEISLNRYIPVRVYFEEKSDNVDKIFDTIIKYLNKNGFNSAVEFPVEHGSWFKKIILRTKDILSKKEVKERLEKVEKAIELEKITKVEAEANKMNMEGLALVISALGTQNEAAIQIGNIILVKTRKENGESILVSKQLSDKEVISLEKSQLLQKHPSLLYNQLISGNM